MARRTTDNEVHSSPSGALCGAAVGEGSDRHNPGRVIWSCHYSGEPMAWVQFVDIELDHFIPERLGGSGEPENIVFACRRCNRSKGSKTFEEWGGPR